MIKLKTLLKNFDDMSLYMSAIFLPAAFVVILDTQGILGLLILFAEIISAVPHECGHYIFNIISILSSLIGMNIHNWEHFTFVAVIAGSLGYTVVPIFLAVFYLLRRDLFRCSGYIAFLAVSVDHMVLIPDTATISLDGYVSSLSDKESTLIRWQLALLALAVFILSLAAVNS